MKKQRFREVKQGKSNAIKAKKTSLFPYAYAKPSLKIKAFLTDSFMLMMPILYVVIYFIMGGREHFAAHKVLGWLYILFPYIIIQTLFMSKTGQTPGYRAYDLHLIDETTGEKPSIFVILFRNVCAILSFFSFFGWIMMFFRKDGKTLHDLLSHTAVIHRP
ncbi:MAG: RDD family protein [Sulfurovum sp.]|nr:MAG: RDD family protein [Sulfurovum sp.]RUM72678.1 MAG: RDD family protein [Sulfurovum sp.]